MAFASPTSIVCKSWLSFYVSVFQSLLRGPRVVREISQVVRESLQTYTFCASQSTKMAYKYFKWSTHWKSLGTTALGGAQRPPRTRTSCLCWSASPRLKRDSPTSIQSSVLFQTFSYLKHLNPYC
jgi:hypothetical protein